MSLPPGPGGGDAASSRISAAGFVVAHFSLCLRAAIATVIVAMVLLVERYRPRHVSGCSFTSLWLFLHVSIQDWTLYAGSNHIDSIRCFHLLMLLQEMKNKLLWCYSVTIWSNQASKHSRHTVRHFLSMLYATSRTLQIPQSLCTLTPDKFPQVPSFKAKFCPVPLLQPDIPANLKTGVYGAVVYPTKIMQALATLSKQQSQPFMVRVGINIAERKLVGVRLIPVVQCINEWRSSGQQSKQPEEETNTRWLK